MYTSAIRYLTASIAVAAAGAVYELFSHGVYSYYMIYAFMIPLVFGALPELVAAGKSINKGRRHRTGGSLSGSLRLAAIATLTAGSLMKGVLEIYGTTNRLTAIYLIAGLGLAAASLVAFASNGLLQTRKGSQDQSRYDADEYAGCDAAEEQYRKIKEYTQVLDQGSCYE